MCHIYQLVHKLSMFYLKVTSQPPARKRRRWPPIAEAFMGVTRPLRTCSLMSNLKASAKIALPPQEASLTQVQELELWAASASAVFCAVTVTGSDGRSCLHIRLPYKANVQWSGDYRALTQHSK